MNDAACIETIVNHVDKVISILKKCLHETQKHSLTDLKVKMRNLQTE